MPPLPSDLMEPIAVRDESTLTSDDVLQVICAWPLSGQYGPGSRALFYALIATCVLARKAEWLKRPCLAAALLFPAVASLHAIMLAVLHREGAVDLDIYGALQLCTIGILIAPVTVTLSQTYFQSRGRNTIFIWIGITLAGLVSLTVEFYRIDAHPCPVDDSGRPIFSNPDNFPYRLNPTCNLTCTMEDGPFSPLRRGSATNIYVIPTPDDLSFGTGTLISAACAVHGILWLFSMMDKKILQKNWLEKLRGHEQEDEDAGLTKELPGANGATEGHMKSVNGMIVYFLSVLVIPIFGGLGLALLLFGEQNLFSRQLMYQTEPISTIGQWSPIAYTVFGIFGSLYNLLATDYDIIKEESQSKSCSCPEHHRIDNFPSPPNGEQLSLQRTPSPSPSGLRVNTRGQEQDPLPDKGRRRQVAQFFFKAGDHFGFKASEWFNEGEFTAKAGGLPTVPGEHERNPDIRTHERQYTASCDHGGSRARSLSRSQGSGSFRRATSTGAESSQGSPTRLPQAAFLRPM